MSSTEADYIVVGGGLTGCAVASRLRQGNPSLHITVIEAGADPSGNPHVTSPMGAFALGGSDLDWAYKSIPQVNTGNRVHVNNAGKALGGGSVVNYGGWARADSNDYDEWGRVVGDQRWSYQGFLPYLKKTETFHHLEEKSEERGYDGPMHVYSVPASDPNRRYGLREPIKAAWTELGGKYTANPPPSQAGLREWFENWNDGQRQPSNLAYGLEGVEVITNALAHRVLFAKNDAGKPIAKAVVLADGRQISARKEIILSGGTFRTPQLLMLSGIGPPETLSKYDIPVIVDAPEVGKNHFDHYAHFQVWKVRHPELGHAVGNPLWTDPGFYKGLPTDWGFNDTVPLSVLQPAVEADNERASTADKEHNLSLLRPERAHVELSVIYAPAGVEGVPMDGTYIATSVMLSIPTSRGSISISSASPSDPPIIDTNYYATQADRVTLIHGTRRIMQAMLETSALKPHIEMEIPVPGFKQLNFQSTDEEIDERIKGAGISHKHAAGSAAMGKVIGTDLKVLGVEGLRVADNSILPVALGGHPQATFYAIAEQAAELILSAS